jgi:peptide/nickel transport system substrate-binding protein
MGGTDEAGSARDGGSIGIGVSALPKTLDPALAREPSELQLLWLVHTPLLTYRRAGGADGSELVPGLARTLPKVSDDGLTYRLRLRPGLFYSNGTPVRPGDFERAIDRVRALHSPLAPLYEDIISVDADASSGAIVITLAQADASFPNLLALPSSAPVPRGTPQRDLSRRPPPGLGPYRLATSGTIALLRARDFDLPGVSPGHVDRITLLRPRPPRRQMQAVITGALDVMQEPAPVDLLPELRSKYKNRYRENAAAATVALVPDTTTPPFEDRAVRGAVSEAVDGETLTRLYHGLIRPGCNILPEVVPGYRRMDPCPHGQRTDPPDLPDAQEQVVKAGAANVRVTVTADPGVPATVERYFVRTLRKIGLAASTRGGGGRLRVARFAPLIAHPAAFLEPLSEGVLDSDLSDAVSQGTLAEKSDEAADAWAAADRLVVDEGYAAPIGEELWPTFLSERLDIENCFRFQPLFGLDLSSLCIS